MWMWMEAGLSRAVVGAWLLSPPVLWCRLEWTVVFAMVMFVFVSVAQCARVASRMCLLQRRSVLSQRWSGVEQCDE